ncbi:unnamed protein product [Caretta caretta]
MNLSPSGQGLVSSSPEARSPILGSDTNSCDAGQVSEDPVQQACQQNHSQIHQRRKGDSRTQVTIFTNQTGLKYLWFSRLSYQRGLLPSNIPDNIFSNKRHLKPC